MIRVQPCKSLWHHTPFLSKFPFGRRSSQFDAFVKSRRYNADVDSTSFTTKRASNKSLFDILFYSWRLCNNNPWKQDSYHILSKIKNTDIFEVSLVMKRTANVTKGTALTTDSVIIQLVVVILFLCIRWILVFFFCFIELLLSYKKWIRCYAKYISVLSKSVWFSISNVLLLMTEHKGAKIGIII